MMPDEIVIDTTVSQKANAPLTTTPRSHSDFAKRIRLIEDVLEGKKRVLYSWKLMDEYIRKLPSPRNDYIRLLFELLADPKRRLENWVNWPGRDREKARKCRYPEEDDHVLRTAIRPKRSTIITEESRMLVADECIYRNFKVHIWNI